MTKLIAALMLALPFAVAADEHGGKPAEHGGKPAEHKDHGDHKDHQEHGGKPAEHKEHGGKPAADKPK